MEAEYYSENISKKTRSTTQKIFVIGILIITISLTLATEANAIYLLSDFARPGSYIDKQWYYFLDQGQYNYLDKGQYYLIGELGYYLGHPFYPRLHGKSIAQTIGFTSTINKGWFLFLSEKFSTNQYIPPAGYYLDTWAPVYRQHYYFADIGKYNYLDKGQYNLLTTLAYSSGYPCYQKQFEGTAHPSNVVANPEPSTIILLGLGAIGIVLRGKKRRT
jgi:hypothetical protein